MPLFIKKFEEVFDCKTEPLELSVQEDMLNDIYSNLMAEITQ